MGSLDGTLVTASISVGGSGVGLELARLGGKDGTLVDTSIGGGRSGLALELARLNSPVVTEGRDLGLRCPVTLVSTSETAGYLRGS